MQTTWKRPELDEELFNPANTNAPYCGHTYSSSEMLEVIDYLDWFTSDVPVCLNIIELLEATIDFRSATTLDEYFVELRKRTKTEDELKAPLDEMAEALLLAEKRLNTTAPQSKEYKLLASAMRYSEESINRRIAQLKTNKDEIYEKFWNGSQLQKVLEKLKI